MADTDWGGQPGSRLGLDIGGTLAKLVFFESETRPSWCNGRIAEVLRDLGTSAEEARGSLEAGSYEASESHAAELGQKAGVARLGSFQLWGEHDRDLSFADKDLAGRLHFLTFRSDHMERFVRLMEREELHHGMSQIFCTGGGAYKYAAMFRERLGVELQPVDELAVVVQGIAWLVERPVREMVWLQPPGAAAAGAPGTAASPVRGGSASSIVGMCQELGAAALFPFLLVNIGSGVSIVKVNGLMSFERVSGSAIGGGTFWGLCRLLCPDCATFAEAGELAQQGDASSVNLLVEDIYGGDYAMSNGAVLPGSLTASFFAKAAAPRTAEDTPPDQAAMVHALTKMISSNICQIAYLNAKMHGVQRIVFTGNFLRQNPVAREAISENMQRVSAAHSGDPFRALFLQHEGYFGALGTFLHNVQEPHKVPASRRVSGILPDPRAAQAAAPGDSPGSGIAHTVSTGMRTLSERAGQVRARAKSWVARRTSAPAVQALEEEDHVKGSSRSPSDASTDVPCGVAMLATLLGESPPASHESPCKEGGDLGESTARAGVLSL